MSDVQEEKNNPSQVSQNSGFKVSPPTPTPIAQRGPLAATDRLLITLDLIIFRG